MDGSPDPIDATRLKLEPEKRRLKTDTYFEDFEIKENYTDISEIFHENTKMKQLGDKFADSIEYFTRGQKQTSWAFTPKPEKTDLPLVELPEANTPDVLLSDAISDRRSVREFKRDPITVDKLSTILGYGCGSSRTGPSDSDLVAVESRGYPSAGGLFPIEPYVFVLDSNEVPTGVYYYSAPIHSLRVVEEMPREALLGRIEEFSNAWQMEYETASILFVLTGVFWMNKIKYGPRGYRFALLEAGHLVQNVQLVASAMRLGTCSIGGLDEDKIDPFLGSNGVDESTVYGCLIGTPSEGGATNGS